MLVSTIKNGPKIQSELVHTNLWRIYPWSNYQKNYKDLGWKGTPI